MVACFSTLAAGCILTPRGYDWLHAFPRLSLVASRAVMIGYIFRAVVVFYLSVFLSLSFVKRHMFQKRVRRT